jgi:hypothetical protein
MQTPRSTGDIRAQVLSEVSLGTTREKLYRILRSHSLVAVNPVLQHFIEHHGGVTPVDLGQWPKAGQTPQPLHLHEMVPFFQDVRRNFNSAHPDAVVEYIWDRHWPCGTMAFQRFLFDEKDRVKKILNVAPRRDC